MQKKDLSLKCFSPPVMLVTFLIEIGAALWILFLYRRSMVSRLMVGILASLAIFQAAEYMICEGAMGLSSLSWARIGYVAISFLPALGLHLGMKIANKDHKIIRRAAYGSAGAFSLFFLTVGHGVLGSVCAGNYVIFEIAPYAVWPYAFFYGFWLAVGIYSIHSFSKKVEPQITRSLRWLLIGYLSFIIPTVSVTIAKPEAIAGIPSVMCGFAILLALILLFKVLPLLALEKVTKVAPVAESKGVQR